MGLVKYWDPDDSERPNFPASGDWLIDPSAEGLTQIAYADGSEVAAGAIAHESDLGGWTFRNVEATGDSIVDAGATGGRVVRANYPNGYTSDGVSPVKMFADPTAAAKLIYFRFEDLGFSSNWQAHDSGINKVSFCGIGNDNQVYFMLQGSGPYNPRCIVQVGAELSGNLELNLDHTYTVAAGERHRYEWWLDVTRDSISMAIDGVLKMDRIGTDGYVVQGSGSPDQSFDFTNGADPWSEVQYAPVWGGVGGATVAVSGMYQEWSSFGAWRGDTGGELAAFSP